jgi:hypothetical protein
MIMQQSGRPAMPRTRAYFRTASIILVGALLASGVSSAVATDGSVRDMTRLGLSEIVIQALTK